MSYKSDTLIPNTGTKAEPARGGSFMYVETSESW